MRRESGDDTTRAPPPRYPPCPGRKVSAELRATFGAVGFRDVCHQEASERGARRVCRSWYMEGLTGLVATPLTGLKGRVAGAAGRLPQHLHQLPVPAGRPAARRHARPRVHEPGECCGVRCSVFSGAWYVTPSKVRMAPPWCTRWTKSARANRPNMQTNLIVPLPPQFGANLSAVLLGCSLLRSSCRKSRRPRVG